MDDFWTGYVVGLIAMTVCQVVVRLIWPRRGER